MNAKRQSYPLLIASLVSPGILLLTYLFAQGMAGNKGLVVFVWGLGGFWIAFLWIGCLLFWNINRRLANYAQKRQADVAENETHGV